MSSKEKAKAAKKFAETKLMYPETLVFEEEYILEEYLKQIKDIKFYKRVVFLYALTGFIWVFILLISC